MQQQQQQNTLHAGNDANLQNVCELRAQVSLLTTENRALLITISLLSKDIHEGDEIIRSKEKIKSLEERNANLELMIRIQNADNALTEPYGHEPKQRV